MSDKALDTTHNPGFKGTHRHGNHVRHTSGATLPPHTQHQNNIEGSQVPSDEVEEDVGSDSQ